MMQHRRGAVSFSVSKFTGKERDAMAARTAFALLIDSDNISARYIPGIMNELSSRHGQVTYRRIYGDWTSPQMAKWKDVLAEYSLTPMQQFPNTTGKNATDSFLIIDAMDILHEGQVGGFCIVSSDSDFTRLASRLRDAGMVVVGMGEEKTPRAFRSACTVFTNLELLMGAEAPQDAADDKHAGKVTKARVASAVVDIVNESAGSDLLVPLSGVGNRLVRIYPDFDVRSFGYAQLSKFLESFESLNLVRHDNVVYVGLSDSPEQREQIAAFVQDQVAAEDADGTEGVLLARLGAELHKRFPSFDVRDYGYSKLSAFIRGIDGVKVSPDGMRVTRD